MKQWYSFKCLSCKHEWQQEGDGPGGPCTKCGHNRLYFQSTLGPFTWDSPWVNNEEGYILIKGT